MSPVHAAALLLALLLSFEALAQSPQLPWGSAVEVHQEYKKQKVAYDVTTGSVQAISNILDRASLLS